MCESREVVPLTLTEVVPGIAVVTGDVPLDLELVGLDLIPEADRTRLNEALGAFGMAASVTGEVGQAVNAAQGLFRVSEQSAAILRGGAHLVGKDGANLGAIMQNGKIVAQARFIPVSAASAVSIAAAVGPALAMVAIQMQLGEITRLVRTNIALTKQVLGVVRAEQWATLTGLVKEIDTTVARVRELDGVPQSAWQKIAGKSADLEVQRDLYRRNVASHVRELAAARTHGARREYLTVNAEAIVFDAHALLTSLKAWSGYQAVHAASARAAGATDPLEARHVELIVKEARTGYDTSLEDAAHLVRALSRELRIIAELPGRRTVPLTRGRGAAKVARPTCEQLLKALEPLADLLDPAGRSPQAPRVLLVTPEHDMGPAVLVSSWMLEDDEEFRVLAPALRQPETSARRRALKAMLSVRAPAVAINAALATHVNPALALDEVYIAITDRRVMVTDRKALTRRGEIEVSHAIDEVTDVRLVDDAPRRTGIAPDSVVFLAGDTSTVLFFPSGVSEIVAVERALRGDDPMGAIRLPALPASASNGSGA